MPCLLRLVSTLLRPRTRLRERVGAVNITLVMAVVFATANFCIYVSPAAVITRYYSVLRNDE